MVLLNQGVQIIDSPRVVRGIQERTHPLVEFWRESQDSPIESGMINCDSALRHHHLQISVAQGITTIPPHVQQDDFRQEVPPFEQGISRHLEQG